MIRIVITTPHKKATAHSTLIALIFTVTLLTSNATGNEPVTPTPLPPKSPIPTISPTPSATPRRNDISSIPLTQADLSVLTGNVQRPNGMIWFNDYLYTICTGDWTIYQLDTRNGTTQTYIYGIRNSHSIFVEDSNGTNITLWIPDFDTNSLLRVNQNSSPRSVATDLEGPWGIALLDPNHFVVTNLVGNSIAIISRDGVVETVIDDLRAPTAVVTDNAFIYVANNGSSRRSIEWISKNNLTSNADPKLEPLVTGLQNTTSMTLGSDGRLYFAYALGTRGVIGRIDPTICRETDGGCTNEQAEIVLYTELAAPLAGLTISPDMRLYFHTIYRPEIYWVDLNSP